jgi:hypothetical protein
LRAITPFFNDPLDACFREPVEHFDDNAALFLVGDARDRTTVGCAKSSQT